MDQKAHVYRRGAGENMIYRIVSKENDELPTKTTVDKQLILAISDKPEKCTIYMKQKITMDMNSYR